MQQSIQCSFMTGALTDVPSIEVGGKFLFSHQHFYHDHIYIQEKELLKDHAAGPDEMF